MALGGGAVSYERGTPVRPCGLTTVGSLALFSPGMRDGEATLTEPGSEAVT